MFAPLLFIGLAGLAAGSFASVVAHRVPRGGSIVAPRSACTACGTQIAAYDNLPVLSWLLLRGRCRTCSERISARYPLTELAVAALFVGAALRYEGEPALIALGCALSLTLVVITVTDLDRRIIPNRVLAAAGLAWIAIAGPFANELVVEGLVSGLAAGGALFLVALAYPKGMGMGDVKMVGLMGLYLGSSVAVALLTGLLAGSIAGAALIARHGAAARKQAIPFGPFLALGGVVALFAGPAIVDWYSSSFFGGQ